MPAWYTYARIDNYGVYPDPDGNFPKPDSNLAVPDGVAITALLPGLVTGVNSANGSIPLWGHAVTVKLDTPLNSLATYTAYLHLNRVTVKVGQRVLAGDQVGVAGQDAMGMHYRTGFALQSGPIYGYGGGFTNVGSAALNPVPLLNAANNGSLNIPSTYIANNFLSSTGGGVSGVTNYVGDIVHNTLNTVPGFLGIIEALDEIEQFQPLTLQSTSGGSDLKIFGVDTGIPDIQKSVAIATNDTQAVLLFIVTNTRAFAIRLLLVLIGIVIAIALVMNATGIAL